MRVNVNCKKNVDGPWCKDERVKRSLFGFGARCCPVFNGGGVVRIKRNILSRLLRKGKVELKTK